MKKQTLVAGLAVAMLGVSATAWAGYKSDAPVYIDQTGMTASGGIGFARNTPDSQQYIGVVINTSATSESVVLYARDASGTMVMCTSSSPNFIAAARSLRGDSYLLFGWYPSGECKSLYVDTASYHAPKTP